MDDESHAEYLSATAMPNVNGPIPQSAAEAKSFLALRERSAALHRSHLLADGRVTDIRHGREFDLTGRVRRSAATETVDSNLLASYANRIAGTPSSVSGDGVFGKFP